MRLVGQLLTWAAFLGGLTFVVVYWVTARWWRSSVGRTMMAFALSETVLLGSSVGFMLFGNFPGRIVLAVVSFAGFTAASWWRTVALVRAQFAGREL